MYYELFAWMDQYESSLSLDLVEDDESGVECWELSIENLDSSGESLSVSGDEQLVFYGDSPEKCFVAANDWIAANWKGQV